MILMILVRESSGFYSDEDINYGQVICVVYSHTVLQPDYVDRGIAVIIVCLFVCKGGNPLKVLS
jgi:hypothetical protein